MDRNGELRTETGYREKRRIAERNGDAGNSRKDGNVDRGDGVRNRMDWNVMECDGM